MIRRHSTARHRSPRRAGLVAVATAGVLLLGSGGAFAYWTTLGSGTGGAGAASFTPPTVTAGTATGTLLYPGLTADGSGTGGSLTVVASNPNPFPISVTVSQMPGTGVGGCTAPAVSLVDGVAARTFTLAANASQVTKTLPYVVSMGPAASNDCQGVTLTIPLSTSSISN